MNYVLYHGNCNDGFGAAFAAWLHLRKLDGGTVYLPVNYGKPLPDLITGSDVYIVDFSYPAKVLLELGRRMNKVVVLDHHKTAQQDLSVDAFRKALQEDGLNIDDMYMKPEGVSAGKTPMDDGWIRIRNVYVKFDMTKSGAILAWEYWHPNDVAPLILCYIQDRDLWKFEMFNSEAVSAYMQTNDQDFVLWEFLMSDFQRPEARQEVYRAGSACLKLKKQMVEVMASNMRLALFDLSQDPPKLSLATSPECFDKQWIVPCANATVFFSEVGNRLLELHTEAPFAAYYLDRADGKRQWGLRSRKEFDCSVIAKAFGGGGHAQASGFIQDAPWIT